MDSLKIKHNMYVYALSLYFRFYARLKNYFWVFSDFFSLLFIDILAIFGDIKQEFAYNFYDDIFSSYISSVNGRRLE